MKYTHEQMMFAAQVALVAEAKASSARLASIALIASAPISSEDKTKLINESHSQHPMIKHLPDALEDILEAAAYTNERLN